MLNEQVFRAQLIALACLAICAAYSATADTGHEPFTAPAALVNQWRPVPICRPA